jgi:UDP-glucose 4-epimerase
MELSNLKILITGAAGFIGSHLSDRLAADNELLLLDDFSVGRRENLSEVATLPSVQVVEADIRDRERMNQLCAGVSVVFHLATSCLRTSLGDPELSHDTNAGGTLSLCRAALERGVRRLVYCSSSEVYGTALTAPMDESHPLQPTTVYGASKLAGELYAQAFWRTHGLPVSVVRPFNTYGPREPYAGARAEVIPRFVLQLESFKPPVIFGDGSQTRDFTYVEDTVTGLVLAGECDDLVGDVVNVARGREVAISRVAELLARQMGRQDVGPVYAEPRPGDVARHYADIGKAQRLLRFEPRVDLEIGLGRTVEWFREQGIATSDDTDSAAPNW